MMITSRKLGTYETGGNGRRWMRWTVYEQGGRWIVVITEGETPWTRESRARSVNVFTCVNDIPSLESDEFPRPGAIPDALREEVEASLQA